MKNWSWLARGMMYAASLGMVISPATAMAETPGPTPSAVIPGRQARDISLNTNGILSGRVVDAQGRAKAMVPIQLRQGSVLVADTATDTDGRFAIGSLRGGVYLASTAGVQQAIRIWAADTAPPGAPQEFQVVASPVLRGQSCTTSSCNGECGGTCDACCGRAGGGCLGFLMNPIVIGAAIAAAIAIPLALDDDDDSAS